MKEVKLYIDETDGSRVLYAGDSKKRYRIGVFSGSHDYVDIWLRTEKEVEESNKRAEERDRAYLEEIRKEAMIRESKKWWQFWR